QGNGNYNSVFWTSWCNGYSDQYGVGDFNGDGKADLWCGYLNGTTGTNYYTALSNGDGTFTSTGAVLSWVCGATNPTVVADFNGDGKAGLYCHDNGASGNNWVALSIGNGNFTQQPVWAGWCASNPVMTDDFNGDGKTDIYCFNKNTGLHWAA